MAAEYSAIAAQSVAVDENILFNATTKLRIELSHP